MAISISDTQRLQALDKQQARIVYLIRHNYSNREIGEALGRDPKTVSDYMAPIYDTLDIHIDNPSAKRDEINNRYAELIDQLIPDDSVLEYWEAIPLPPDIKEEEIEQPGAIEGKTADIGERITDIGETQSATNQSESILQELDQIGRRQGIEVPPPPRRFPRWLIVVIPFLILCLACASVVLLVLGPFRPLIENAIAQIQATQPITEIQEPFTTQEFPVEPTSPLTETPNPPPTKTTAADVLETTLPTSTNTTLPPTPTSLPPTSTPTPTETIQPTPSALFESDLDSGMPEGMDMVYGEVNFVNGKLIAQESTLLSVGNENWNNYEVEYETKKHTYCWGLKGNGVSAHAADPYNMVIWSWNYCESAWYELVNGEWEIIEGSKQGNIANPGSTIKVRLVAEGGKFTLYVNNQLRSSIIMDDYSQGKVYILLSGQSVVDNILVSHLH